MLAAAVLVTISFAPPWTAPAQHRLLNLRSTELRACDNAEEMPEVECSEGRIVTELVEAGNSALPDRFMMAVRAIRGEFSPTEGVEDTEFGDDMLTACAIAHRTQHQH